MTLGAALFIACPYCAARPPASVSAYVAGTALLLALPLGLVMTLVLWIRRAQLAAVDPPPPPPSDNAKHPKERA